MFQRLPPQEQFAGGNVPWRVDPALSGGGFFFEGACHTLDFLDFLFGPVETVRAFAANQAGAYKPEDLVTASLRFASGVHASGAWCFAADADEEYNEIVGAAAASASRRTQPDADPRLLRRRGRGDCRSAIRRTSTSR